MQVSCMTKTMKNMQNNNDKVIDTKAAAHIVDNVGKCACGTHHQEEIESGIAIQ